MARKIRQVVVLLALSALAMCFSLTAHGASSVTVSTAEQLFAALSDNSVNEITLGSSVTLSAGCRLGRSVQINGAGHTLTAIGSGYIQTSTGAILTLSSVKLGGQSDFAVRAGGPVILAGNCEITDNYGILLGPEASLIGSGAVLTASGSCDIAVAANTGGNVVQVTDLSLKSDISSGTLFYIYRSEGTVTFRGANEIYSLSGNAVRAAQGSTSRQELELSANALLKISAIAADDGEENHGAALNVRELSLKLQPSSRLEATGSFGGIYCDSLTAADQSTVIASNSIQNSVTRSSHSTSAITVFGKGSASTGARLGNNVTVTLSGYEGLLLLGSASASRDIAFGSGCTFSASLGSSGSGDAIRTEKGSVSFGSGCTVSSCAPGRFAYCGGDFTLGDSSSVSLGTSALKTGSGIYSSSAVHLGNNSSFTILNAASATGISASEGVMLKANVTFNASGVSCGIRSKKGVSTGDGCAITMNGVSDYGIAATGTLLADKISFGAQNLVNITSDGGCLYSCEGVEFTDGCQAVLSAGEAAPAIKVETAVNEQGFCRVTASKLTVASRLRSSSATGGAVDIVGAFIAERGSVIDITCVDYIGLLTRFGDVLSSTNSVIYSSAGCGIYIDSGNLRLSQGGRLCAEGTLDSGIRISNGILRVSEGCTLITQGTRFGAEVLGNGGIWLERPEYFDIRSTKTNAFYIENGSLNFALVDRFSAWYFSDEKTNAETWWSADPSSFRSWEIHEKLSSELLEYADYTQLAVNATQSYKNNRAVSGEGFGSSVGQWRPESISRLSIHKTRPTAQSNLFFIPAGRSFSWLLKGSSVEGSGEVFTVSGILGEGDIDLTSNGRFTYSAPIDARGIQVFEFTVTGQDGAVSLPAALNIRVTKSKPPAAYSSTFEVDTNSVLNSTVTVEDYDGNISAIDVLTQPSNGSLVLGSDGRFKYTPKDGFSGVDSFTFIATDNDSDRSSEALATVLVGQEKYTSAYNITHLAAKNETVSGALSYRTTVVKNSEGKAENLPLESVSITQYPTYGVFELSGDSYTYTPFEDFAGTDTIKYYITAADGTSSNEAVISIITVPSQKPVASPYLIDCISGRNFSQKLSADDLDGTVERFVLAASPEHGEVELDSSTGRFTYTSEDGYTGSDSFSYYVYDDEGLESETALVSIEVRSFIDALKASGELSRIMILSIIAILSLIVTILLVVVSTYRRRRDQEREYYRAGRDGYDE